MNKRNYLAIFLASAAFIFSNFAYAESLKEAMQETLAINPTVQEAAKGRLATDQALRVAKGGYLPSVDITAAYGRERSNNTTTRLLTGGNLTLTRREAGVELRQLIFDGAATSSEVARNQARVNSSACFVAADANDTALRVAEAYVNVLRGRDALLAASDNLQAHRVTVKRIEERTRQGISSKVDFVQAKGRLALAKANKITEASRLRDSKVAYLRVVGHLPGNLGLPRFNEKLLPRNKDIGISFAVRHHPRLASANADIDATYAQHRAAISTFFPRIDGVLGMSKDKNIDGVPGRNDDYFALVQLSWNVLNGGSDLARTRETAELTEQAGEVRNRTYRQVVESLGLSWIALVTNEKLRRQFRDHMTASKETVRAFRQQYKLGQRTLLDLLDQENEYFSARLSYINATYDHLFSKLRVYNSMGILVPALNVSLPPESIGCLLPVDEEQVVGIPDPKVVAEVKPFTKVAPSNEK